MVCLPLTRNKQFRWNIDSLSKCLHSGLRHLDNFSWLIYFGVAGTWQVKVFCRYFWIIFNKMLSSYVRECICLQQQNKHSSFLQIEKKKEEQPCVWTVIRWESLLFSKVLSGLEASFESNVIWLIDRVAIHFHIVCMTFCSLDFICCLWFPCRLIARSSAKREWLIVILYSRLFLVWMWED